MVRLFFSPVALYEGRKNSLFRRDKPKAAASCFAALCFNPFWPFVAIFTTCTALAPLILHPFFCPPLHNRPPVPLHCNLALPYYALPPHDLLHSKIASDSPPSTNVPLPTACRPRMPTVSSVAEFCARTALFCVDAACATAEARAVRPTLSATKARAYPPAGRAPPILTTRATALVLSDTNDASRRAV